jgi:hypothetical protein
VPWHFFAEEFGGAGSCRAGFIFIINPPLAIHFDCQFAARATKNKHPSNQLYAALKKNANHTFFRSFGA